MWIKASDEQGKKKKKNLKKFQVESLQANKNIKREEDIKRLNGIILEK